MKEAANEFEALVQEIMERVCGALVKVRLVVFHRQRILVIGGFESCCSRC